MCSKENKCPTCGSQYWWYGHDGNVYVRRGKPRVKPNTMPDRFRRQGRGPHGGTWRWPVPSVGPSSGVKSSSAGASQRALRRPLA